LVNNYVLLLPGPLLSGISIYFLLSYLFVPIGITIASAIIISALVFGLSRSFSSDNRTNDRQQNRVNNETHEKVMNVNASLPLSVSKIVFVIIYLSTLIITGFFGDTNQDIFTPWSQFTPTQILQLISSILLCFFLPGFALVNLLENKNNKVSPVPKVLLAYIFSTAITGLAAYLPGLYGIPISEITAELISVYVVVLIVFIVKCIKLHYRVTGAKIYFDRMKMSVSINRNEFLVFGSLFAFVVLSTYVLYQGVIIGDQWFHHGRTLSFMAGAYTYEAGETFYPSFFHAVLGTYFSLSGVPSVNAYVSINFLNMMPVVAFYYFFKKWIPGPGWHKGALLASAFFILSSGFGWIDVLTIGTFTNPIDSQLSALRVFHLVETETLDIRKAGDFVITGSPAPTTGLMLIGLPAGLLLLGFIKEKIVSEVKYIAILALILIPGILSHDEFYLFVITCAFLPLIFRLERVNSLYLGLLSSLFIVILIDVISPELYYTGRTVLGEPVIVLNAIFVGLMWILYVTRIFRRIYLAINKWKTPNLNRRNIYFGIVMAGVVGYLYLFTFLVWEQLSGEDVQIQQYPFDLPWYLYPLKLGVTGLLGFAFLISYIFKRFEKEVFVLGLIAIIALLVGPYYDEYRFSKYIMAAMGAFAALLIYKIISTIKYTRLKPLLTGVILGLVISSSSLSTLMFMGYTASALQNPDFEEFHKHSQRRIFPSLEEIHFFNTLHKDIINLKTDYVTVPAEYRAPDSKLENFEYQTLIKKIQAFVGSSVITPPKFFKSPFTLNSTSLIGFYSILNDTNTQYIILPKENTINDKIQLPAQFALENFPRAYEDSNYIVLTAPSTVAPISSSNNVALLYQPEGMLLSSLVSEENVLQFKDSVSETIVASDLAKPPIRSDEILRIFNGDKRSTIWSDSLQKKEVNYIEAKFRVVGQNDNMVGTTGIVWKSQDKEYHVSLEDKGLRLFEKPNGLKEAVLLSENRGVEKERSLWYTVKIVTLGNTLAVYLNDILKLQVQTGSTQNYDISKIGIRVDGNTAEFEPINVGYIPQSPDTAKQKEIYYHLYYPLSELALSKTAYDTFLYGDRSAFSHKTIIMTAEPEYNDPNFRKYLDFVDDGGRIVIVNAGGNFDGGFSKLLNVNAGNTTMFDGIVKEADEKISNPIAISGVATNINLKNANVTVKSYYMDNEKKVAPFAMMYKYGSAGGEIILVNSAGYFDAVFKSPEQFFMTLDSIPRILDLEVADYTNEIVPNKEITDARFVGDLSISGQATMVSSSLLLPNAPYGYRVEDISISKSTPLLNGEYEKNNLKNVVVKNLTLSGSYQAIVESTEVISVPSWVTQYDYFGLALPKRVDLTLKLLDDSGRTEFMVTVSNSTGKYNIPVSSNNKEEIRFHNMDLQDSSADHQTIIMKRPEVNASGNIAVNNLYVPSWGEVNVNLTSINMTLDHSDNHLSNYRNASSMQYVTYLKWIQTKNPGEGKGIALKIPGDISERAKRNGVEVPWEEVMVSKIGIILILSVISATTVVLWRPWRLRRQRPEMR